MEAKQPARPKLKVPKGLLVGSAGAGLAATFLVLAVTWWPRQRNPRAPGSANTLQQTWNTPYRNVAAGVKYVGDQVCADCHPNKSAAYHSHPMGRSFAPIASVADQQGYTKQNNNPFDRLIDQLGFHFRVERKGGQVFHETIRRDPQGRVITQHQERVAYVLGSGSHGCSFVVNRDGFLFQSAISWFAQKNVWDLSPGFDRSVLPGRVIMPKCLYCHCNEADAVPDTINHYQNPIFGNGYAIGCERCHGPGQLHVERRQRGEVVADVDETGQVTGPFDNTIVNPGRLKPALREAVCQQCHLQGEARTLRRGHRLNDYRPGLPLREFWSVFVLRQGLGDSYKAVGQVEQMYSSRCFRSSGGKLGCISCHDAHGLPASAERLTFYRQRCLQCHQDNGCSLPLATRLRTTKEDSCIQCHMPRFASENIAHTAITDHRILRQPVKVASAGMPLLVEPWETPLVNFYEPSPDPHNEEAARDLGLALVEITAKHPYLRSQISARASRLLEKAVQTWPDDLAAREGLGHVLRLQGRAQEALAAFETALAQAPNREFCLHNAALLAAQLGRRREAIAYWERAVAVNPQSFSYHARLAELLAGVEEWDKAITECQAALRDDVDNIHIRSLLARCYSMVGKVEQARAQAHIVSALERLNKETHQP